ncbi:hypothetical protein PQX77_021928 [Marasmius sp. AFHP31]|nr:hypothetical protein PQX77_021928 [Marasmius sp. AFHP31]
MKSVPIINRCSEQFQWEMNLAWYNYHKAYVDQFAAIARDVLLDRQMYQSSQQFGNTILTLEKQHRPKAKISSETHDGLMLAALRYGTRPTSQYMERGVQAARLHSRIPSQHVGVQTTPAPRISCRAQTNYSAIAPPLPTPPEPLDVINEEGEYEDEEDILSDTETHFDGEDEHFENASEVIPEEEDDIPTSHQAH